MARQTLRLPADLAQRVAAAATSGRFHSKAAWMRQAFENQLARQEADMAIASAEKTAASIARLTDEVTALKRGQQATIALVDSLAKVIVTCVPEPTETDRSKAKERHHRFLKAAAAGLNGSADLLKPLE
jgi:Arc/MetJ-type ribon-helix-helix transcriptional regulator